MQMSKGADLLNKRVTGKWRGLEESVLLGTWASVTVKRRPSKRSQFLDFKILLVP